MTKAAAVERYLDNRRPSTEAYSEARAVVAARGENLDADVLRRFWEKALGHMPAARADVEGIGPRAMGAYRMAAASITDPWCLVLSALSDDDAIRAAPLLRLAEHAAHVPDGGTDGERAAITALTRDAAVIDALVAMWPHFAHGHPLGFAGVLLASGSAAAVACVADVVDGADEDDDTTLAFLSATVPSSPTPAAQALLAKIAATMAERFAAAEHPALLKVLQLDAYPARCQLIVSWPTSTGHSLSFDVSRHGVANSAQWWLRFGKGKAGLQARGGSQYPNKYGVPLFSFASLGAWIAAVEARFKTRFLKPVVGNDHGFPHPVGALLCAHLLAQQGPAPTKMTTAKKTPTTTKSK